MSARPGRVGDGLVLAGLAGLLALPLSCAKAAAPASVPSWTVQASGTAASLRGVSAVDDRVAWASGANGTVLRTLDGGTSWTVIPVAEAENVDFRDIEAFGPDDAVIMGIDRPARIYRTTDGGRTWALAFIDDTPGIFLDGMAFFDDRNGLAFGDPMDGRFYLIATADGGASWTPLPAASRPAAQEGEAAFAASGTSAFALAPARIWLATGGSVSRVWRSKDRGRRWEPVASGLLQGLSSAGGFSVAFLDGRTGIAVGGDYRAEAAAAGNAAVTADGGRTWAPVTGRGPGGFREAVAFVPGAKPAVAIAVGPSGSDLSLDRGRTWTPIQGPAGFHSLSFANKGRAGWAVGRNGLIARLALSAGGGD